MLLLYLTLATRYLDSLCCDFVTERTWLEAGDLLLPGVQMRPRCDTSDRLHSVLHFSLFHAVDTSNQLNSDLTFSSIFRLSIHVISSLTTMLPSTSLLLESRDSTRQNHIFGRLHVLSSLL